MRPDLPSGSVTFLFTDVEGSTLLLHELGAEVYADALAEHRRLIRAACVAKGGVEVDTQGDAFFFAFPTAPRALAAASAFTDDLASGSIRVRVGLHTGTPLVTEEGYVGDDVHLAARVAATSHGGQIVLTEATAGLVEDALTDLGSHRLKDIAEAVSIYQLGAASFPPLKTIANTNLPTPASRFLGRKAELREADEHLQQTRLLTVFGPGGQGKTRFALELARRAREERFSDYAGGVFSCFLSSLREPSLVLATIAQTLSLREQPGQKALDALASHLEGKKLLLFLDNLEHLLEAGPELSRLLERASGLTLLVTSRELLRLHGERAYALPPLAEDEGIALFCERAQLAPSHEIAELCSRLEGLPLAIELAAARTRILTPSQLLERLSKRLDLLTGTRDADPRQQTLRATIEWSYDLLTTEERALFRSISVFQGGYTLEAAEEVCSADLDALQSLVDKSLLRFTDGRFWMLETIREYAAEKLEESGARERLREKHLAYFVELAERVEPDLKGESQLAALEALDADHDNVRVALDHGLHDRHGRELAARMAVALLEFWDIRSHYSEARAWYSSVLEHRVGMADVLVADALYGAGKAAHRQGDQEDALQLTGSAADVFERTGDQRGLARALGSLAFIHLWRGEADLASECAERAVAAAERAADPWVTACALAAISSVRGRLGDSTAEVALLEESLRLFVEAGDRRNQAIEQLNLGVAAVDRADYELALALFTEAESNARAVDDLGTVANSLTELGELALATGRPNDAAAHFGDAFELGTRYGMSDVVARCRNGLARIDERRRPQLATPRSSGASEREVTGDE